MGRPRRLTHLALSAVDIALWDLKAKHAGQPLWQLLGGSGEPLEAYNTDGGWLNWSVTQPVDDCRRLVKRKAIAASRSRSAVRTRWTISRASSCAHAIGPRAKLMVRANGRFDLPAAIRLGRHLGEYWRCLDFEEPIWYDDIPGHARLAASIDTPIALGEQLYRLDHFRDFIGAGAVHFVQPDAVRLAGVTEWWQVADLALAHRLPVAAHIGDMAQVHVHLSMAHTACRLLEYIPWMRPCFEEPATVKDGYFALPQTPGASTTLRSDALGHFAVD